MVQTHQPAIRSGAESIIGLSARRDSSKNLALSLSRSNFGARRALHDVRVYFHNVDAAALVCSRLLNKTCLDIAFALAFQSLGICLLHSSRRLQRVTVEPRRARFEHERASLTSTNPLTAGNLLIAAALPPRNGHHSMPRSNVGFLVLRSSDFQSDAALATPIDLHLHMVSLALVRQEHELARSARNADIFDSRSLKHPLPNTMQGFQPVRVR